MKPFPFKGTFKSVIHWGKIKSLFERLNLQVQFKRRYQIGGSHSLLSSRAVQHGEDGTGITTKALLTTVGTLALRVINLFFLERNKNLRRRVVHVLSWGCKADQGSSGVGLDYLLVKMLCYSLKL